MYHWFGADFDPVVGTALFGWTHFDSALYSQNWNVSAGSDGHAVITAVLICLWSFVGVESAAVSSGMVENPKRTVPLATMLGTGLAGLIYVLSTQMISGMFLPLKWRHRVHLLHWRPQHCLVAGLRHSCLPYCTSVFHVTWLLDDAGRRSGQTCR